MNMCKATSEITTEDVVMPWIADAIVLAMSRRYVTLDMSSTAMAMQSVKQCLSVVSTVVATDYVGRMVMGLVPEEFKDSYIDPVFNCANEAIASVAGGCFYNTGDA